MRPEEVFLNGENVSGWYDIGFGYVLRYAVFRYAGKYFVLSDTGYETWELEIVGEYDREDEALAALEALIDQANRGLGIEA